MLEKSEKMKTEVWDQDRCAGCGACVSACLKGMLEFKAGDEHPTRRIVKKVIGLTHNDLEPCAFCDGDCAESCPRLREWEPTEIGHALSVRTTRSGKSSAVNDVVADLLSTYLTNGFIDGAIVMDVDRWTLEPVAKIATTVQEIIGSTGHQNIWVPLLSVLGEAVNEYRLKRLAVVGLPCAVQAAAALKDSSLENLGRYGNAIELIIGTFCGGVYKHELVSQAIVEDMGIQPYDILSVGMSPAEEKLTVVLQDGSEREIPIEDAAKYTRKGCARCEDFLAEAADFSIGSVGAKKGYCTVIAWTPKGEGVLKNATNWRFLETDESVDRNVLRSLKEEKERRKRVRMLDSLSILLLDALGDAKRLEEAKRRFGSFYNLRVPEPTGSDTSGCGSCSLC